MVLHYHPKAYLYSPTIKEKALTIRFGLAIALGTGSYLVFGL